MLNTKMCGLLTTPPTSPVQKDMLHTKMCGLLNAPPTPPRRNRLDVAPTSQTHGSSSGSNNNSSLNALSCKLLDELVTPDRTEALSSFEPPLSSQDPHSASKATEVDEAVIGDTSIITALAKAIVADLPQWAVDNCRAKLTRLVQRGGALRVASLFSGSDFSVSAIEAFINAVRPDHFPCPRCEH
eukprot:6480348-Amphidinium_carterae.1